MEKFFLNSFVELYINYEPSSNYIDKLVALPARMREFYGVREASNISSSPTPHLKLRYALVAQVGPSRYKFILDDAWIVE